MIRILLVDDQALLCEVLKTWLEVESDFQVVGITNDGESALKSVESLKPDVVLIDVEMPGMDGLKATELITSRFPNTKVIVLSAHDDDSYLLKSLRAGAKGYLLKNTTAEQLASTIRLVEQGQNQIVPAYQQNETSAMAMQKQLEAMVQKYEEKFQSFLAQVQTSVNGNSSVSLDATLLEDKLTSKLEASEAKNSSEIEQLRQQINALQAEIGNVNSLIEQQFKLQIQDFKEELHEDLTFALQQWSQKNEPAKPDLSELESKYRTDLMTVLNPLRANLRELDQQTRFLRSGLLVSVLTAAMSLTFASWVFVTNTAAKTSTQTTAQNLQSQVEQKLR